MPGWFSAEAMRASDARLLPQQFRLGGVGGQHLHSDGAVQPRVMSTKYNAHAAAAEFGFDSVAVGYEIAQHGWRQGQANCTRTVFRSKNGAM